MLVKQALDKFQKVSVCVDGGADNKFKSGKKSTWFKVYDTNPDEVLKVIMDALVNAQNK